MPDITYEQLLERSLARVSADVDKIEGTLIYDAIVPCVLELWEAYLYIDELLKRVYADTAYNEYLDRRCEERGIYRKEAVKAIRLGYFNIDVPIGSRWAKEELVYTVVENLEDEGYVKLECNETGEIGNKYFGEIKNMDAVDGVTIAELRDVIIPGSNVEDDESLRKRYFDSFEPEAFGGNIKDYKDKVGAISGVGQVKVYPVWNGGGTVKLLLLNSDDDIPSDVLINEVQTKVDPEMNHGEGLGIAPIGHVVTVEGAKRKTIDISFRLLLSGVSFMDIKDQVEKVINDYFKKLRSTWSDTDNIILRISQIESRLLDIAGIVDIYDTSFNGTAGNITLEDDEVPKLGEVSNI